MSISTYSDDIKKYFNQKFGSSYQAAYSDKIPYKIGASLPVKYYTKDPKFIAVIDSGSMISLYEVKYKGVTFYYGLNCFMATKEVFLKSKIYYIMTTDKKFETPCGYNMNLTYGQLKNGGCSLVIERGVTQYVVLPSGWRADFFSGRSGTDKPPDDNDKVTGFFAE